MNEPPIYSVVGFVLVVVYNPFVVTDGRVGLARDPPLFVCDENNKDGT